MKSSSCVGKTQNLHIMHAICSWTIYSNFNVSSHRFFMDCWWIVMFFQGSISASPFDCIFNGKWLQNCLKKTILGANFSAKGDFWGVRLPGSSILAPIFFGQRVFDAFWSPFGSILHPFGPFLAQCWYLLGALWFHFRHILRDSEICDVCYTS